MPDFNEILIPKTLLDDIISIMEYMYFTNTKFPMMFKFVDTLLALRSKQKITKARHAYTQMRFAKDDGNFDP